MRWDWGGAWLGLGRWAAWLAVLWATVGPLVADRAPGASRIGTAALGVVAGAMLVVSARRRWSRATQWGVVVLVVVACGPPVGVLLWLHSS